MRGYPKPNGDSLSGSRDGNQIVRDQFSRRLYSLLLDRGWTQSELARRAGVSRDNVSTYITAKALPSPAKLDTIAKALGVAAEELLPPVGEAMQGLQVPIETFSFKEVEPGKVRLQVNKLVSLATAMKVGEIISSDKTETSN